MVHFFILFPLLLILGGATIHLYRKHPGNVSLYYFRNFFLIWSICTLGIGAAETFFGTPYAKSMALSFAVPFLYVASAYLVRLPFVLYQKVSALTHIFVVLVIVAGVLFGLTTFVNANKLIPSLGPLAGVFSHLAQNLTLYRIWTTLAIFVPIGAFFFYEAANGHETKNRIRAALIGGGLVIAGLSEWFHIQAKHAASADFYTVIGFFLVVVGLFYAFWTSPVPLPENQQR